MLTSGAPFPYRTEIILVSMTVIVMTLVVQGLTLAPLIRAFAFAPEQANHEEERLARREMLRRGAEALDDLSREKWVDGHDVDWLRAEERFENADALWREIRETGDLGVLLAKRASGLSLSPDEQRRMREQLVDVVKAVPSLAVFALPGGFVLLPLLLKLLPFDLRPSSFRDLDDFHAFARNDDEALTPKKQQQQAQVPAPPRFFRR